MTTMTYSSLVNSVILYATKSGDSTFSSLIPTFIMLAETRCSREVKNLGLKMVATSVLTQSNPVYQKPNRWRETVSLNFGTAPSFTSVTRSTATTTRTITFATPHPFGTGSSISVFNMSGSGYNGNFTVVSITQTSVAYTGSSGTETSTSDTGGMVTGALNERVQLYPRSYEYCNSYWPDRSQTSTPVYYADYNYDNFLVVPTPVFAAPFELVYFEEPAALSDANQTSWLTQYAPDLILYATLLEASPYLRNDPRTDMWQKRYDRSASAISGENKSRFKDATIDRSEG